MEKKVKIGIIGCGGIANGKHMPSLAKLPDVEMVAFCDLIPERAEKAAKEYGTEDARVYTDYKELLEKETEITEDCEMYRAMQTINGRWRMVVILLPGTIQNRVTKFPRMKHT